MIEQAKRIVGLMVAAAALFWMPAAYAQQGQPVKQVWAEQYNNWNFASQQANSYIFAGTNCQVYPQADGVAPSFFAFGLPGVSVYYPVLIQDANPSNSEIVTPSSISTVSGACGFSASTANQHTSFQVLSGTAGLQEAVATLGSSATPAQPINVMLDRTYYRLVSGLPGNQSVGGIVANLKGGSLNVNIIDTTTAPWTYYVWNGTAYTYLGSSTAAPTLAESTGAGTSPTASIAGNSRAGTITLTTGTSPAASATVFTLTWPAPGSGGPGYALSCTVASAGSVAYTSGTFAVAYSSDAVLTFTASATALAASTSGYKFVYHCN